MADKFEAMDLSGWTEAMTTYRRTFEALAAAVNVAAVEIGRITRELVRFIGPAALERYAVECMGVTEADIRSVDYPSGEVRLWNRRRLYADHEALAEWARSR